MTTDTAPGAAERAAALAERLFGSALAAADLATIHIGDRLGLFAALADEGPATPAELAARTGTDERYVREWLEQQAVTGILTVDADGDAQPRRFALPSGHDAVLVDPDSPAYSAPLAQMIVGAFTPMEQLLAAFRAGAGVPYADYGRDTHEAIAALNRPAFLHELAAEWMPALPDVDRRLREQPEAHVADIGCGHGWSTIALARAYPDVLVDGFDLDDGSIARARENAAGEGLSDRVRFFAQDAADRGLSGSYTLVTIFEALHDMAHPVQALETARRLLEPGGAVLVADSRAAETFTAPGDELERFLYGCSVLHCLAVGRCEHDSAATGTVMRPATLRRYALEAGFSRAEVLPIENDFWRFYRLHP